MADVFNSKPGQLVKVQSINGGAALLTLSGIFPSSLMIGTSFGTDRVQDTEYQKSLTGKIYTYAFGEGVGKIQVGGMLFFETCSGGGDPISELEDYYSSNNIYNKSSPTVIGIGSASVSGYLEGLSIVIDNPQYNSGGFSLTFSRIPQQQS